MSDIFLPLTYYESPVRSAILFFPVLAVLFTIPYIIHQYRKYGAVAPFRAVIVYSFILYLTCAYFLTILPLPPVSEVAEYTTPCTDLVPFHFVKTFLENSSFVAGDPGTWITAVTEQCFYEPFFNVLLLLPLGVYLRYYYRRGLPGTVIIAFLISLSFELIQLSALFGLYPRPYRVFQVDDLILNTFGGLLGWLLAPLFSFFLPSRQRLDEVSYRRGRDVSLFRRGVAFLIDWGLIAGVLWLLGRRFDIPGLPDMLRMTSGRAVALYALIVLVGFILLPWAGKGKTIGRRMVSIRVMTESRKRPSLIQYLTSYGVQYYLVLPAPFIAAHAVNTGIGSLFNGIQAALALVLVLVFIYFTGQMLLTYLTGENRLFYEKWSRVETVSTIDSRHGSAGRKGGRNV